MCDVVLWVSKHVKAHTNVFVGILQCLVGKRNKVPLRLRLALGEFDLSVFQPAQLRKAWMENLSAMEKTFKQTLRHI